MEMEEGKLEILGPQLPSQMTTSNRSEARIRYYKSASGAYAHGSSGNQNTYTRSRKSRTETASKNQKKESKTWKERILFQAIICGALLAVLLFFNVVDSAFTNGVTDWVDRNLTQNIFNEDGGFGSWLGNIFGNDDAAEYTDVYGPDGNLPQLHQTLPLPAEMDLPTDSWIDEAILYEIQNEIDIYFENNTDFR